MTLKEYRQIDHPTLEDLEKVEADFIFPKDVAVFIKCEPYNMNVRAKTDIELYGEIRTLGFPAHFQGTRLKIPRIPFIQYMKRNVRGENAEQPKLNVENIDDVISALDILRKQIITIRERQLRPFPN